MIEILSVDIIEFEEGHFLQICIPEEMVYFDEYINNFQTILRKRKLKKIIE